jgi:hypothetical protein
MGDPLGSAASLVEELAINDGLRNYFFVLNGCSAKKDWIEQPK